MSSDEDSDEEDFRVAVATRGVNDWFVDNYDVLEELFGVFKTNGKQHFGNWFFQHGGFHDFVTFILLHSQLSSKPP